MWGVGVYGAQGPPHLETLSAQPPGAPESTPATEEGSWVQVSCFRPAPALC